MKANLDYVIRPVTAPGEARPSLVPVIVNRIPSRPLSAVISNAIKNNLIAGLQPSAVGGIAAGLADQIYDTLCDGRGVRFGSFFYVRPYLTGRTDANGTLRRKENGIDATVVAGPDFALTLDDFSLHFTGKDGQPKVGAVKYNAEGSDNGFVKKGTKTLVYGDLLVVSESDDAKVAFAPAGGGTSAPVEVAAFDFKGAQQLEFDCPAALEDGRSYEVQVSRSDAGGNLRVSNTKRVKVLAGAVPPVPGPTLTAVWSDGQGSPVIEWYKDIRMSGGNLALGAGGKVDAQLADTEETDTWYDLTEYVDRETSGADGIVLRGARGGEEEDEGVWDRLGPDVQIDSEHSQVRFRVTTAGGSATIVADTLVP